jgi:ABC-type glycerol-3-phosphate transport system substrate-binding protein
MKKVIAIVAIATLAACGSASTEVKSDSTVTTTDTVSTVVNHDSTYYRNLQNEFQNAAKLKDSTKK